MKDLAVLRDEIDNIDRTLVELYEKRMLIVEKVAEYKLINKLPVLNESREETVIRKNINYLKEKRFEKSTEAFFKDIMRISREFQKEILESKKINEEDNNHLGEKKILEDSDLKIGFQGVSGSFSEEALFQYFGENVNTYNVNEFEDVFIELKNDKIQYGVLPIENSSTGAISEVYDLLNKYELFIIGEVCLKINQNLMGIQGAVLEDIKEVYSHPQGFEQCKEFLKKYPDWRLIPYYNTAKSAEYVKEQNCKSKAVIASEKASKIYDLEIFKAKINSNTSNTTRFAVIGKKLMLSKECNKISVVLGTEHKAGCLFNVLRYFAENNINLLKIESRPIKNTPWEYFFYVDFEGNLEEEKVKSAINLIKENSHYFKIIGNYKKYQENA